MSSTWIHDELVARLGAGKYGYNFTEGWDQQDARYKSAFKNFPDPSLNKEVFSNYRMKVYQGSAWAIFDMELRSDKDLLLNESIHTAFLEKEGGEWKISYLSTVQSSSYDMAENNLKISETYHNNNPGDTNDILSDEFIGHHEHDSHTWNKENHWDFRVNNPNVQDSIYGQLGEGNWVATMYQRKMNFEGKDVAIEAMHFKRFENGKIAEIWEFYDSKQID